MATLIAKYLKLLLSVMTGLDFYDGAFPGWDVLDSD